jgi:hypothetical protein
VHVLLLPLLLHVPRQQPLLLLLHLLPQLLVLLALMLSQQLPE